MEAFIATQAVLNVRRRIDISTKPFCSPVSNRHITGPSKIYQDVQTTLSAAKERSPAKLTTKRNDSEIKIPELSSSLSRLSSAQDRKWLHKVSSIVHLTSSLTLLSFGLFHYIMTGQLELPPDQFFNPVYISWVVSTIILSVTGSYIAIRYRNNDKPIRNAFVGVGTSSAFNVWMSFYSSQLIPNFLSTPTSSVIFTLFLSSINIFLSLDAVRASAPILKSRATSTANLRLLQKDFWLDFLIYVFPVVWALPLFLIVGPATCIYRGHEWVVHLNQQIPGLFPARVYVNTLSSIAATVAAFAVTLRDRRLISKSVEMLLIASTSTSALFMVFFVIFTHREHVGAILGLG